MNIMSFTVAGLKAANGIPNIFCLISLHLLTLYYDQAVLKDDCIQSFFTSRPKKVKCKVWVVNHWWMSMQICTPPFSLCFYLT